MIKHRKDSILALNSKKSLEELEAENEALSNQVTDLQLALCDFYESVVI